MMINVCGVTSWIHNENDNSNLTKVFFVPNHIWDWRMQSPASNILCFVRLPFTTTISQKLLRSRKRKQVRIQAAFFLLNVFDEMN